jgi:tetratricopeptide (TPR) repeat protein
MLAPGTCRWKVAEGVKNSLWPIVGTKSVASLAGQKVKLTTFFLAFMQKNLALFFFLTLIFCVPRGLHGTPVDSLMLRIQELQATDQTSELLEAMQALAQQYKKERAFDNLESLLSKGLRLAELQQDEERQFYFLLSLGEYYYFPEDDYPQSIAYLLRARSLGERVAIPGRLAHTLSMIAEVYLGLGDFQQALDYQLSAMDLAQESGDTTELALSYRNMGAIYWNQQAYESALDYFKRALRLYEGTGDPHRCLHKGAKQIGRAHV